MEVEEMNNCLSKFYLLARDVTKTGNGEWGMGNGKLKMGNGKLKMGN